MSKNVSQEDLARRLAAAASLNPPEIREIEFEVRSMGHLPPKDFAALSDADVAAKEWIDNRMIVVEWNYHVPTAPTGDNEANLKDFLDRLKDDQGEQAVHDRSKKLGIQYLGTYRLGYLSFDPAGHFKTIFAFANDAQMESFLGLPKLPGNVPQDASADWQNLEEALDRNFRKWIGRTSPQRIISYRPAIAWRGAKP